MLQKCNISDTSLLSKLSMMNIGKVGKCGKKMRISKKIATIITCLSLFSIGQQMQKNSVFAENQLEQKQIELNQLEQMIGEALKEINSNRKLLAHVTLEIDDLTEKQQTLETNIANQEEFVALKKEAMKKRLVILQTSNFTKNSIMQLITATSFTDFLNRFWGINTLFVVEEKAIKDTAQAIEDLAKMKQSIMDNQEILVAKKAQLEEQTKLVTEEIDRLRTILHNNRELFIEYQKQQHAKESQLALEARELHDKQLAEAEKDALENSTESLSVPNSASTDSSHFAESENKAETVKESTTPSRVNDAKSEGTVPVSEASAASGQRKLTVSATAYSYNEPNLTHHTATGIDLRKNPLVIAVDPKVIPLGSLVDVPGYGLAIAGDTGGAIKGNKIDLHFEDVNAVHKYGRKTIEITIFE